MAAYAVKLTWSGAALGILLVLHIASSSKLVCHMTNWAQYRPSGGKFTPDNIDPFLCTHVIYTLATINSFNEIVPVEWNDEEQFVMLYKVKDFNPALKTLLSVGGTVSGISPFIAMVAKPENRAIFIKSAINYLRTHNFDGLNLAWEYPAHNGSPKEDKEKFTLLVTELSRAFGDEAKENKKTQLLLSANVGALPTTVDKAYDVEKISALLDFMNVMTYDFHGHWEDVTGHNSPLYKSNVDSGTHIHYNIDSSVSYWITRGAPSDKLLLGFPTYGRTFRLSSGASGLGAPANGPADAGPYTRTEGFWSYYEICNFINSATVSWIDEQHVPYATYGSSWLGYDDKRSISSKVQWMTTNKLGGAHVWTMDMDDFAGSFCSEGPYPLINHLRMSMGKDAVIQPYDQLSTGFAPKPTTTPRPTTTRDPIADFCHGRPDGLYPNAADKTTYFQCFQGNTYLHRCQPGLIYYDSCKCCLVVLFILHIASSSKLVCHMTNWAQYRPGNGRFTPDNIDPFLCTHVIYALATINSFNQITPIEWNDEQQFVMLNNLKNFNPALKTLLSVGGTVNGVSPFIAMVARPETRAAFIKSAISYLRTHNFDGLNLAWEYPAHNGSPDQDKERFTLLITELVKAFEDDAKENRKTQLLLSANVAGIRTTIDRSYDVSKISILLDFLNVMTYDFHGHWESFTGHNSPLYQSPVDSGSHIHYNIDSSVSYWITLGAPAEKLLLGLPTYGRTYRLSSGASGLGAPSNGPADAGPYTRTAGFWSYYEICNFISSATVSWIDEQHVPYATYGSSWLGYDDKRSISSKVQWMTTNKLGGAHVWTLDMDDFAGSFCSEGPYPLINHLRMSMGFGTKPTTTPRPTTTRDPNVDFCHGRPDGLYPNAVDKTTYFQCFQGNTYLHRCPPGLIYQDSCKCCNWP
ncbi:putative chitinase 10 [Pholidichthys leucotaenia]